MTTTDIKFQQVDGDYICQLTDYQSKMRGVISLALSEPNQTVSVCAFTLGMPPMVVRTLQTPYGSGLVFELDFPEGVGVMLRSSKPVIAGVWIS